MESKESYRDRQENELEVLRSIFGDDVIDLREKDGKWEGLNLKIKLEPQRDSRVSETFCKIILCIKCPKNYPKVTPIVTFEGVKGLSNTDKETLLNQLKKEAYGLKGEVMIFELCQLVQSFLHERNVPPKGSFYDEMLANKQKRDQDELTQQKEKEEKLRQQLQDEVLKRKEQIRKEQRIRRTTINESPMRNMSSESSNSESRFYIEACDEHKRTENIYFPIEGRKILQGACIGHSLKGCINFSGIDLTTGRLYYLTEWTVKYSQLEIKNLKVDEVIDTIEKKVAVLSKLRHKNLVAYDGVLCTRKKDSIVVTLVQDFLFGISVSNMSVCWNWSAECVSSISKNVLESLVFLHNNGVSHGNLIDSTVFTDSAGNIKVSDYSIVPYLQELTTGVIPSPDLPSLGSLIESLMPTPHLEIKNFINECKSERTLSASDLLEHPFLYPVQMGHDDSQSPENQKLMLSCPPPVAERVPTNINKPIVIAPLISSNHSRLETEFELMNHIGRGAYGDVLKVRNNLDNRHYAIKRIPLSSKNKQLFRKMTREVELLSRLNHENVVRYFNSWIETQTTPIPELEGSDDDADYSHNGRKIVKTHSQNRLPVIDSSSSEDDDSLGLGWNDIDSDSSSDSEDDGIEFVDSQGRVVNYDDDNVSVQDKPASDSRVKDARKYTILYIQMEFCEKSTLRSAIDDSNLYQNKERYWKLFREIVEGLSHIHQQGMIHRDLKCENIFLDSRDHVKIGDFGLATTSVLALQNQHTDLNQTLKPPQITYSDSHTGLVGTALYVAPELTGKASKSVYNQKVDLYSLGIIFFEMIMPPLRTGMERIQTILNIRKPDVVLPTNLEDKDYKNEIQLLKWLLEHNISKRPTSEELLQSELLPQAKLEVSELQEMLRGVLSNPQSRNYKYLVNRLIQQESDHLLQYTYHSEIPLQISSVFENVKSKVEEIFRKHGGIDIQTPLLTPYIKTDKETVVKLMTHSGCVVTLPDDLRSLFLRYVTANGINLLRRYAIGRVFREYKMHNSHPKQTFGCEFDIVTPTRGNLLVDAELLVIAHEIINEFDVLKSKDIMFKINHTSLIRAIFLYYSVPTPKYKNVLGLIKEFKEEKISKFQLQSAATTLLVSCKPQAINSLIETLLIDIEMSNISSTNLRTLIKGRGEAASLCKGAIRELEAVANLSQALGVTIPIHLCVSLSLNYDCSLSGNIVWEMVGKLKKKGKDYPLATGGRYDHEIENYKKWSQKNSSTFVNRESYCAGLTFHIDRLVGSLKMLSDTNSYRAVVDLVVYVTGSRPPLKDVCHILKTLWNAGIKCYYIESQADDDIARDLGANHIIILGENGCLRIKSWQNCRYDERTVSRAEAIDYLKKNLKTELSEIEAESYNVMRNNSLTSIINENNVTVVRSFQIVFITNEKLNANKKKRLENQIEQKVSNVMLKFCKKMTFIVFAVEIDASQIRQMLTCIEPNPKDQSQNEFDNLLKGFPKNKHSYLQEIYDEITEKLMKDKNTTVAGLFGIQDSYCRIVL